ncbi:MAG: septum formation initiator family protein [Clostridia bacterium]|jgi:cell division protein FtsL|nr:septum formation initiator family protein [Clostridia bacterium]
MRKNLAFFGKIVFVVVVLFLVVTIINKNLEINDLKDKEKKVREQMQAYTLQVERLSSQLEEEVSEETIKRIAREKLNLRDPGDLIYANEQPG